MLALAGKTVFELATGCTVLATLADTAVVVSVPSHIAGAVVAAVFYGVARTRPRALTFRTA